MILRRKFINSISIIAGCFVAAMSCSAPQAAVIVSYDDSFVTGRGSIFTNTNVALQPRVISSDAQLNLPRFDPGLGTLIFVELSARLYLESEMSVHCRYAGICYGEAKGGVGDILNLEYASAALGIDLGPDLVLDHRFSVACDDFGLAASCFAREVQDGNAVIRNASFGGSDIAPFIGLNPIEFEPSPEATLRFGWGAYEGFPADGTNEAYADATGDVGGLLYIAGAIRKKLSSDPVHTGGYSHAHIEGYSIKTVSVRYEYEPFAAVPEPATWAMMIAGFGLIGGAMRRKARAISAV